ncbi:hypothetical protein [Idiomarina seosinensis]|uniref:DUF3450 domain-containing protein n=1 Tax=Idiomarina seosinensis TaxID=281739 RepID=A0A432ZGZ3_9GAMM|nr:hypothetical protein [Idiomarina seosinensis]RUO77164.1 hypothetical protein CWI81_01295 [Idiomarina seosinensis]
MKRKRFFGVGMSLLMAANAAAEDGLPLKLSQQWQQLTHQHQQVQLQIQQQRLANELAQLQLDYAKLRREQAQVAGTEQRSSAVVNDSENQSQLVSEVRFNEVRLSLFRRQQQWRWQRSVNNTGEQSR